jgi:hypothetical protein
VAVGGVDVAFPELLGETETGSKVEDDVGIRTGVARRRDDRRAQLDQRLRLLADLETNFERLPLKGRRNRQDHIGELGGRVHE